MNMAIYIFLLSVVTAFPAYAGQATIRETDNEIVIEYMPSEEDVKSAQTVKEQAEKQRAAEEADKKKQEEKTERRRTINSLKKGEAGDGE